MYNRTFLTIATIVTGIVGVSQQLTAQNLSIGLIGGGTVTDAAQDVTTTYPNSPGSRVWSQSKDWMLGLTLEYRFRPRFSVEVDGMYHELHITWASVLPDGTLNSVSPSPVVTWEFPILAKYRFGSGKLRPFIEAGPSFRTTGNLNFSPSHYGAAGGVGFETHWHGLNFAPVVRYTRWAREKNNGRPGNLQPNQLELLVSVSRVAESNMSPVGPHVSLGAVAGWGLTPDVSSSTYAYQTIIAVPQPGGGFTYVPGAATQHITGVRSFIAGPSVEIHFTPHLSVEIDALHKPLRSRYETFVDSTGQSNTQTSTFAATWQFPVLAKYRLHWGKVNPFAEAGPSFRLPQGDLSTHGVTAGAGLEMHLRALKIAPALRFTHWGSDIGNGLSGVKRNEASLLVGFSFGGTRLP